jgi:hypothetical protein
MKTLFVALVALLFAFFIGCQSSITDPVSETTNIAGTLDEESFAYKDAVSVWPGVIDFNTDICEPIHNTCNTTVIAGVVRYKVDKFRVPYATEPVNRKVSIYINAKIKYGFGGETGRPWIVFGMSEEIFYWSTTYDYVYIFEKEFAVRNTGDLRLKLVVKFEVIGTNVKIASMVLRKCADVVIGDPEF